MDVGLLQMAAHVGAGSLGGDIGGWIQFVNRSAAPTDVHSVIDCIKSDVRLPVGMHDAAGQRHGVIKTHVPDARPSVGLRDFSIVAGAA